MNLGSASASAGGKGTVGVDTSATKKVFARASEEYGVSKNSGPTLGVKAVAGAEIEVAGFVKTETGNNAVSAVSSFINNARQKFTIDKIIKRTDGN